MSKKPVTVEKIVKGRPKCVECGSPNPASNGNRWQCTNRKCGRQWVKIYRGKFKPQELWPSWIPE